MAFIIAAEIRGNHNDNQIFVHGETKDTTGSMPPETLCAIKPLLRYYYCAIINYTQGQSRANTGYVRVPSTFCAPMQYAATTATHKVRWTILADKMYG